MLYALVVFLVKTRVYDRFYGGQIPPKRVNYWKPFSVIFLANNYAEYYSLYPEWVNGYMFVVAGISLLAFMFLNRHIFSAWLIAAGGIMNIVAVAANGGYMPWSPVAEWALIHHAIEGTKIGGRGLYLSDPNVEMLVDRFMFFLPSGHRWAWSIGDAVFASGLFYLLGVEVEDLRL